MTRGMRVREALVPALRLRARFSRMAKNPEGLRPQAYLQRWPCSIRTLSREEAAEAGMHEATHVLSGPVDRGRLIQSGDRLDSLMPDDGRDYVRPGKPWSVIGRRHTRGFGDMDSQEVYVREEV